MQQRTTLTELDHPFTVHVAGHPATLHYKVAGPDGAGITHGETALGMAGGPDSQQASDSAEMDTVLVLHGWGSSAAVMSPVVNFLSKKFRVYNLDFPGHGRSPEPPVAWGLEEHAEAVGAFAERFIPGRFSIFGHSNGGRIALFMASSTTEGSAASRLQKLVLVSPSGMRRRKSIAYHVRRGVAAILKAPFRWLPAKAREYGLDWLRHTMIWSLLGSSDYRTLHGVMRDSFVKTVNGYIEDRIGSIRVPVLLFWGDKDDAIDLKQMESLKNGLSDAGLVTVKDAGHYAFLDEPSIIEAGTMNFLTES